MTPFATPADGAAKKPKIHARSRVGFDCPPPDSTYMVLETYHALGPHRSLVKVPNFYDLPMMTQTARPLRGKRCATASGRFEPAIWRAPRSAFGRLLRWSVLPVLTERHILKQGKIALGCAVWSGKRCIQSLKVLRREGHRKRHCIFLDVRWRSGFWNCDNAAAADHPGQRNRGGRATMGGTHLRQPGIIYYKVIVSAERRERHDRQVVLLAPR